MTRKRRFYPCVCHPRREHVAKGLCKACYEWFKRQRAKDIPSRRYRRLRDIVGAHAKRKLEAAIRWEAETKELQKSKLNFRRESRCKSLRDRYGITIDDYERLVKKQQSRCAICDKLSDPFGSAGLYVDHCHATGKIRGLLCPRCNTRIATIEVFIFDEVFATRALDYLLAMRLRQHPELRASLPARLRASLAKARAVRAEREARASSDRSDERVSPRKNRGGKKKR